jgi:hypothetical protein
MKLERGGLVLADIRAGSVLKTGDIVAAGVSPVLLSFNGGSLVKVSPQSRAALAGSGNTMSLELLSGEIFFRVRSAEGFACQVLTPDAVVTVKGTVFSVSYAGGVTRVLVHEGLVLVLHRPSGMEFTVSGGQGLTVKKDGLVAPLSDEEAEMLKRFASIKGPALSGQVGSGEVQALAKELADSEKSGGGTADNVMSLEALRARYGRLDEIVLYNGKKYTGVIVSRGENYGILTPAGHVTVKNTEIRGTAIIK